MTLLTMPGWEEPNAYYHPPSPQTIYVCTAAAQGAEAKQVFNIVANIGYGTAYGYSDESHQLHTAWKRLVNELIKDGSTFQTRFDDDQSLSYTHIPLKPAFTVQATYKFIGKLKPRQFDLDE